MASLENNFGYVNGPGRYNGFEVRDPHKKIRPPKEKAKKNRFKKFS